MNIRNRPDQNKLVTDLRAGDRFALAKAITIVESTRPADQELARDIVAECLPYSGKSVRYGISGAPGAGKSTFIEAFGSLLTSLGRQVAVLAIDPSSAQHHGSILGDKTRMERLSRDPHAFIRPSPAGTTLGGVARKTRETIILCEAAGFNHILIETVGVGQSETAVQAMSDFFILLLIPGAGDDLQGIKRGIVEMADLILVNKADGDRADLARQAQQYYQQSIHLLPPKDSGQLVKVSQISSLHEKGIAEVLEQLEDLEAAVKENGFWQTKRKDQARYWFREHFTDILHQKIFDIYKTTYSQLENQVLKEEISPFQAASMLLASLNLGNIPERNTDQEI
jgi:LAO/AO transport system kinase